MINFKTHGEALDFCKKYGFHVPGNIDAFEIAEAFLRAYKDGAKEQATKASATCPLYVDYKKSCRAWKDRDEELRQNT